MEGVDNSRLLRELKTLQENFYGDKNFLYEDFLKKWNVIANSDYSPFVIQFIPVDKECKTCVHELLYVDLACIDFD